MGAYSVSMIIKTFEESLEIITNGHSVLGQTEKDRKRMFVKICVNMMHGVIFRI